VVKERKEERRKGKTERGKRKRRFYTKKGKHVAPIRALTSRSRIHRT